MSGRHLLALVVATAGFVWLHAGTVPPTLGDEDTVNLALGVESFNVARYAPHPPGYPVYIVLGKASTAAVTWIRPEWSRDRRAAAGLAWLSILAGALGVFAFAALWRALGVSPGVSTLAAIATAAAPLYWFTAARPLTDIPGLVAAVAIQAALLHGLRRMTQPPSFPFLLVTGSLAAGLAIGLRSQTMWMTLPLLAWVIGSLVASRRWSHALAVSTAVVTGVLLWFVPLIQLTGGFEKYLSVLDGQGRADFVGVQMLATNPSWALLKEDLVQTFLAPWRLAGMPWVIISAAVLGLVRLCADPVRRTQRVALLAVLVVPYLAFHLLFHEVETIRYALPPVMMVAGLAVIALGYLGRIAGATAAIAATVAAVAVIHPVTAAYAEGAPVFRVINDIQSARATAAERPQLEAHHDAWWATSRALSWHQSEWDLPMPRLVSREESLRLVEYWRSGATTPIWFLSDPDRGDLARFDPGATRHERTYKLSAPVAALIAGLRPYDVGWWRLTPPAWMLGRGWAVTEELAHERADPHRAVAFLRRHTGPTTLFIGARHLEAANAPAEVSASLDGVEVDRWAIEPGDSVTRWITLPDGSLRGDGAYAVLTLSVGTTAPGAHDRQIAFDQFAATAEPGPLMALGRGWSPVEGNSRMRRASRLSELEVRHAGRPIRVTMRGYVPGGLAASPTVLVMAGNTLLARFVPGDAFEQSIDVSPHVLDAAGGAITIAVDQKRSPDERLRGVPRREFLLRFRNLEITDSPAQQN